MGCRLPQIRLKDIEENDTLGYKNKTTTKSSNVTKVI